MNKIVEIYFALTLLQSEIWKTFNVKGLKQITWVHTFGFSLILITKTIESEDI